MGNIVRDAALSYLGRGWSIFPLAPFSKKPPKDFHWREFQSRRATRAEVEEWYDRWPQAGVAIVTGKISNLVVFDVDPKHGADPNHIYREYPSPIVGQTGGGGGHFFFEYPKGQELYNTVGKKDGKPTGYDLRAEGGYVAAPPTIHPNGRRYKWLDIARTAGQMPKRLIQLVQPAKSNGAMEHTEPWLADALQGVGEGMRDDTCARLAGYYLSKGMPVDVVIEQLKMWNERNDQSAGDPFTDADVVKTVESVQRTRSRRPSVTHKAAELDDAPQDLLRLMSLQAYMAHYGQYEVGWAVQDWLPDQTIGMMVSPPGTYKTWMLIDLALSIATGTPFLGVAKVLRKGPVLIYQQEDYHGQMTQRIATIMASRFTMGVPAGDQDSPIFRVTLPPSPPIYLHDNRELRFDNPEVMDVLEARIAEIRPVLVIVDPLYTAVDMRDYMIHAVPHMMRLKRLRDQYGTSFMISHHTAKRAEKSSREDAWGSQFLNAFLETGWQVRPRSENTALLRRHFKVTKDAEEIAITFDIATDRPSRYHTALKSAEEVKQDVGVELINAVEAYGPIGKKELAKAMGISYSTIHRRLGQLIAQNVIQMDTKNELSIGQTFDVKEGS